MFIILLSGIEKGGDGMTKDDFEKILDTVCTALTVECRTEGKIDNALAFENRVREVLDPLLGDDEPKVDFNPNLCKKISRV